MTACYKPAMAWRSKLKDFSHYPLKSIKSLSG
ncbi:Uncharacterised protein [Vibrio cholerae]|nr:Uncharacterised protein [Vibrio cholerae]